MKLVRDLIPQIIEKSGLTCKYHFADNDEYEHRLFEKMIEELDEFRETPNIEEAADMYEVLISLCWFYKIDMKDVIEAANLKKNNRGGFIKRQILEDVVDNDIEEDRCVTPFGEKK